MVELNYDVIKIFIEGWLVSYHGFSLNGNQVEKLHLTSRIVFQLHNIELELKDVSQERVLVSILLPKYIDSKDCISIAMKSYLEIVQVIEKEKL